MTQLFFFFIKNYLQIKFGRRHCYIEDATTETLSFIITPRCSNYDSRIFNFKATFGHGF